VLAAEGAVLFLEKLAPAIEGVDSSSGSIGSAVNRRPERAQSGHGRDAEPQGFHFGVEALALIVRNWTTVDVALIATQPLHHHFPYRI
jgi:hypothetical protein